ncbi:TRAFAC clade GTPase domain-containing protein [Kitasatospora azatica]|uniref:TRAFAC clade GTPase domain-containing protein n=1 Tax=Kitasatospora azatica TaxID=58347 RepID=UPI00068FF7F9|nr:hypothetical protein [Kitasatospora azatica]
MSVPSWLTVQNAGLLLGGIVGLTAALVAVRSGPEFYGALAQAAGRRIGPWQAGRADSRVPLPGGTGEPAHASYWWRQVWVDSVSAVRSGFKAWWRRLAADWLAATAWRLMQSRNKNQLPFKNWLGRKVVRLIGAGIAIGAVVGAALAAVVALVMVLLFAVQLGLATLLVAATAGGLRALEWAWLRVRRIRLRCPYPGCWEAIALPTYQCPGCARQHRALRPGRYGVLRRVCQCGRTLPTSALHGRGGLTASCPHCARGLPAELGAARLVHLPLIGADSAGKTMFLMAVVTALRSAAANSGIEVDFAADADRDRYERAEQQLAAGDWVNKTNEPLPQAFLLRLSRGRSRRLLYLYDPMGESLRRTESLREQRYLAHADGLLLICDVLAQSEVRRTLNGPDESQAQRARPALESPMDTYERLVGEFGAMSPRRRRTPVAVVVTKRDVLDGLGTLPRIRPEEVREWLSENGLRNLVQGLQHDFGGSRYWSVSSQAATGPQAQPAELRQTVEPVLWLLARTGLRTRVRSANSTTKAK